MSEIEKKPTGRWKPGRSGNPAGRKPGTGEVARLRAAIAETVPELLKVLAERALTGDIGAARLLLERTIAPLKPSEEPVSLALPSGALTEQGRAVLAAIATGELAPGQGAALLTSLCALAKLTETDELERRIKALEERNPQAGATT